MALGLFNRFKYPIPPSPEKFVHFCPCSVSSDVSLLFPTFCCVQPFAKTTKMFYKQIFD